MNQCTRQNQLETPVNIVREGSLSVGRPDGIYSTVDQEAIPETAKLTGRGDFPGARFASEMQNSATVPCLLDGYAILYILYTADI